MKNISKKLFLIAALAVLFSGALVLHSAEAASIPSCSLATKSGDIKVDFGGGYLLTYTAPITKTASLMSGYYDIYLQSFDSYTDRTTVYQPYEQYFVRFNNGSTKVASSGSTTDLKDYIQAAYWQGKVSSNLYISKNINKVIAEHTYYGQPVGANSVRAICMVARPIQVCGNGTKEKSEECDDGNRTNGDGCSATCTVEPSCGDGKVNQSSEECDDGNNKNGDGCSATCKVEPFCGDGEINQSTEQCDDGNNTNGDGCSATCKIETPDPFCGDGKIDQSSEQCDDGNNTNGDGCSATCKIEAPEAYCGDGVVNQSTEQCDDGNNTNGDGCSATCKIETPDPYCGDGEVNQSSEECDDGNNDNDDSCSNTCKKKDDDKEKCNSSIGNEIWFDMNKNGVKDLGESGIPGVTVKLINGNRVEKDTTNSRGHYKFDDLCKGTYTVVVDANDIPVGAYQVYDPDGKLDNTNKVKLSKNDKHTKADFGYYSASAPATGPGSFAISIIASIVTILAAYIAKRKGLFKKLKNRLG